MKIRTIAFLAFGAGLILVGCATKAVDALELGNCFDVSTEATEVSQVPTIDCAKPHDAEVYHLFDLASDITYDEEVIYDTAAQGCLGAFAGYVGVDFYDTSVEHLDIYTLYPLEEGWKNGDHGVVCSIVSVTVGEKLTGSQKGAFAQN